MPALPPEEPVDHESFSRQQLRARKAGFWILGVGLILAGAVYSQTAPGDNDSDPNELNADNSKLYETQVERIGGKSAVLGIEVEDNLTSMWHGRNLAYTLAGISVAAFLLCFIFSSLTLHPPPEASRK